MIKYIAEIGWNHVGDMDLAKRMVLAAKNSGATYAKFQTWSVSRLRPGSWDHDGRREIYQKAELTKDQHYDLKKFCDNVGIKFLTSCFCADDLEFIRSVSNEVKIPSFECSNTNLVDKAVSLFDHVYISTGGCTYDEWLQQIRHDNVTLLHCVSCYPCPAENVNLERLKCMHNIFSPIGYSGHYPGIWDAIAAVSLGATVIEKHFTIDQNLPGRDNKLAILPEDFEKMVRGCDEISKMIGCKTHDRNYQDCEKPSRENDRGKWNANISNS